MLKEVKRFTRTVGGSVVGRLPSGLGGGAEWQTGSLGGPGYYGRGVHSRRGR